MSTATTERRTAAGGAGEPLYLIHTPRALQRWSDRCRAAGMDVGLVPTMGALHEGHRSLVRRALAECDRVVVSIFVNPAQFGAGEDIDRYPRSLERDIQALVDDGVHAAFVPSIDDMYPPGSATTVQVDPTITDVLEGAFRPGHFGGVALVVAKLFNAARPRRAYFGEKDAQQCAVVRRLAADLDTGVDVVISQLVRDDDGLALSSRNQYLTPDQRRRARAIPRGLAAAWHAHASGEQRAATLCGLVRDELDRAGIIVDYVALVDPDSFRQLERAAPGCQILVAGRMAATRLIDVVRLGIDEPPAVAPDSPVPEIPGVAGVQGRE